MSNSSDAKNVRRLAAIVFTDVVGYTARMQIDEVATLALVGADFATMRAVCAEHGGEVLNAMGDGLLLSFSSAVQAVACALKIQAEFGARRLTLAPEQALEHRLGVHLGDVFRQEAGGVAGDGVNIAARLQTKAPPGGICISQTVYDTVKRKVAMQEVFLGEESFKNISEPIPVWHIAPEGGATLSRPPLPVTATTPPARTRELVAAVAACAALAAAGWWFTREPDTKAASVVATPRENRPAPAPSAVNDKSAAADKSIVVLPFENLSPDPANAFFAEGLHAEIIAAVGRVPGLKVISRNSALHFKDSTASLAEIARTLGVAHVVTGSVRREGDKIRILLELRRTRDDAVLWSPPPYDRELKDVFAVQGEIAAQVARLLQARQLTGTEASARLDTTNPQAYDSYLKGKKIFYSPSTDVTANEAASLFAEALRLDPNFAGAAALLSAAHSVIYLRETDPAKRDPHAAEAKYWAETAMRLAPGRAGGLAMSYYLTEVEHDPVRGLALAEASVRTLPNEAVAYRLSGTALLRLGRLAESSEAFRRAMELDPLNLDFFESQLGALARLRRTSEWEPLAKRYLLEGSSDAAVSTVAGHRFRLRGEIPSEFKNFPPVDQLDWLLRARRWDAALAAVTSALADSKLDEGTRCDLLRRQSDALQKLGRTAEADEAGGAALMIAEKRRAVNADATPQRWIWALVAAGRADEAFAAARRYVQDRGVGNDDLTARWDREQVLARVLARAGRTRESVAIIKQQLVLPSMFTVPMLRAEVDFDNLRDDPEFKALLADPKNSAPL